MFDVAIIGAGPAGTAAAYDLLLKGFTVLLLDKYKFPRKKACAGGITPKAMGLLRYDISDIIQKKCYSIKITPPSGKSFLINEELPLCYTADRKELDLFSLNKAIDKGTVFKVVMQIDSIVENQNCVKICAHSKKFYAKYLIGADGANSFVRKYLYKSHLFHRQMGLEADVRIDSADRYPMEFDFSKNQNGYYWIFPKEKYVNIGIYSTDSCQKTKTQKLINYAQTRLGSDRLENIKGYPICTNGFEYQPESNRIFLVGDAAGMSEKLLGEGIYFALKTGQEIAEAIFNSTWTGLPVKYLYSKSLKRVQMDLKLHNMAARCLYNFPDLSLKILSKFFIHRPFATGYAKGLPLIDILSKPAQIFLNKN